VPLIVRMNAPLPAVLLDGLRLVIVGTGGSVIVNTREFDVSPPVGDVDTVIGTVPAKAISEAGIAALNRVAETNVVLRFDPFQRTTLPETNPLPFTVSVNAVPPDVAEDGLRLVNTNGRGFTVTSTNPDALPPFPSLTVTLTRYTVVDVTRGGVYVAVAPVPDTLPPVADQE